jgi:hypothetical protein
VPDKPFQIVRFWQAVEIFSPQQVPGIDKLTKNYQAEALDYFRETAATVHGEGA